MAKTSINITIFVTLFVLKSILYLYTSTQEPYKRGKTFNNSTTEIWNVFALHLYSRNVDFHCGQSYQNIVKDYVYLLILLVNKKIAFDWSSIKILNSLKSPNNRLIDVSCKFLMICILKAVIFTNKLLFKPLLDWFVQVDWPYICFLHLKLKVSALVQLASDYY